MLAPRAAAVVLVGMPPSGVTVPLDPTTLAAMNQRVLGSRMGQTVLARDIPWLIDAVPGRAAEARRADLGALPAGADQRGDRGLAHGPRGATSSCSTGGAMKLADSR
jgi:hypothetical protein